MVFKQSWIYFILIHTKGLANNCRVADKYISGIAAAMATQGKNFKYAGLQYENQCWCGNSYGSFGAADPSICNMSCPIGNRTCGGKWANDVYEITNLSINMKIFTN